MIFLLAFAIYAALIAVVNWFNMLFIGNLYHVNPELLPALSYGDTFSLFLPLYIGGTIGLFKVFR
jgi:hypothetical protein